MTVFLKDRYIVKIPAKDCRIFIYTDDFALATQNKTPFHVTSGVGRGVLFASETLIWLDTGDGVWLLSLEHGGVFKSAKAACLHGLHGDRKLRRRVLCLDLQPKIGGGSPIMAYNLIESQQM